MVSPAAHIFADVRQCRALK